MEPSDPVVIGVAVAPHGVRGTLRVRAAGSGRHLREGVEPFVSGRRLRILRVRPTPKGFLIDFEGVEDREQVGPLKGQEILLDRSELDAPEAGEFYVGDLIGLAAVTGSGEELGTVQETFETGAHEVLVIRGEGPGAAEHYVPFTLEHVPEVDLEEGRIVVHPPEE
jgi:16S rRNA processing protein RimM